MRITDRQEAAFTSFELLVVIVTLTMLSAIFVPRLAKAHSTASVFGAQCLNNQRQLAVAALMYADDNHDSWLPNFPGQRPSWIGDTMDFNAANIDNTNIAIITNSSESLIAPFIQKPQIVHCPADQSYVVGEGRRVRSVAMNGAVGTMEATTGLLLAGSPVNGQWLSGTDIGNAPQTVWKTYGKTADMNRPTPAMLFIFADEHPNSISDGTLAVQMALTGVFASIIDYPGSYHNGAGSFSFADGHAELHPWLGQAIQPPIVFGGAPIGDHSNSSGDSAADMAWLQQHTSAKN